MRGDITVTRSTLYEGYEGIRLPREVQIKRVNRVIAEELTPIQREILLEYYIQNRKITEIARDRGIHKSTVSRTLKRAEGKLRRYLRY